MAVNSYMRFCVYTLIDISETKARRGDETIAVRKQQNFNTVLQTIGIRANLEYLSSPEIIKADLNEYNFGTDYKGEHNIWRWEFTIPFEDATNIDLLQEDFNIVPVIPGLDESIDLRPLPSFFSKNDKKTNIYFEKIDK